MRDQPLIKPTRVRIPTVLKDEWTEMAECTGKKPTLAMCRRCKVIDSCAVLYYELAETLDDPETLTGIWGGEERGREKDERYNKYDPPPRPTSCSVEGCTYKFNPKHAREGVCQTHRKRNAKKDSA